MTVQTTTARTIATGNGVTVTFNTDFEFFEETTLVVTIVTTATGAESVKALTTDYTVSGGDGSTGSITFVTIVPASTEQVVIERVQPYTQGIDFQRNDPFPSETNEKGLDRLTHQTQQLLDLLARSILAPLTRDPSLDALLVPEPEDGELLVGKADLSGWENKTLAELGSGSVALPLSIANGGTNSATEAAARVALGLEIGVDVNAFMATVTQAKAEAGTATDREVWTAERVKQAIRALEEAPRSYKSGCEISNDAGDTAHDVNTTAGHWRNADDDGDLVLASEITKQIDATWAAGDDAGGLSSSLTAPANDTWYNVFLILVSGSVDVGFDTSEVAANLITDHSATKYRLIGRVKTNGSANIKQFFQVGNEFWWAYDEVTTAEHTVTNTGANGTAVALDNIPDGVSTIAMVGLLATGGSSTGVWGVVRGDQTITALPAVTESDMMGDFANTTVSGLFMRVPADASQQVKVFSFNTTTDIDISVWGWIDERNI